MMRNDSVAICWILAATLLLSSGCAAQKQTVSIPKTLPPRPQQKQVETRRPTPVLPQKTVRLPEERQQAAPTFFLPDMSSVQKRVRKRQALYERKLSQWYDLDELMFSLDIEDQRPQKWHQCLLLLEEATGAYSGVLNKMESRTISPADHGQGEWQDIIYIESGCDTVYEGTLDGIENWQGSFVQAAAAEMEKGVFHYNQSGRYGLVIETYENLMEVYPGHTPSLLSKKNYTLALLRNNRAEAAILFLKKEVDVPGVQNAPLRKLLADALLIAGKSDEAKGQYQQLADLYTSLEDDRRWVDGQLAMLKEATDDQERELALFANLLKAYFTFDGKEVPGRMKDTLRQIERRSPGSMLASRARQVVWLTEEQAGAWVGRQLVIVENLVEEKEYQKALALLQQLAKDNLPAEVRRIVQDTMADVRRTEQEERQARDMLQEQAQAIQWDKAVKLLEMRHYDEAIEAFALLAETSYEERAQAKALEAANSAAANLRRKAAALFVKARRSSDVEQQKELMLQSRKLLLEILDTYPESDVVEKVKVNLVVLEEQMREVDPALLGESDEAELLEKEQISSPTDGGLWN